MAIKLNEATARSMGKTDMTLYHFYRIVNNVDDRCYIGQTIQELRKRLRHHLNQKERARCSSQQLVEQYGRDALDIILIHSLEFNTSQEAHQEERRLIEEHREQCVNIKIPYVSVEEKKAKKRECRKANRESYNAKQREWQEANREAIYAKHRKWREANREALNAKGRERREANKEAINAKGREWREANKDAINAKRRERWARAKKANTKSEPTVEEK